MVGRMPEGAAALEAGRSEHHILIERTGQIEQTYDRVDFACLCPNCGAEITDFQTKDLCNQFDTVDYRIAYHFYAECRCGTWLDFIRKPAIGIADFEVRVETG